MFQRRAPLRLVAVLAFVAGGALLACGCDGEAASVDPERPISGGAEQSTVLNPATTPTDLALGEDERARIAEIEHHVLKLSRNGFPALAASLRSRDRDGMLRVLDDGFTGHVLALPEFRDVSGGAFRTRLVRATDEGTGSDVDAAGFVDHLLALRNEFTDDVSTGFKVRLATPAVAGDFAGRWNASCLLQLRGTAADGGPRETKVELEFETSRMPDVEDIATAAGWIAAFRVVEVSEVASREFLMADVASARGFDVSTLHDNWTAGVDGMLGMSGGVYVADFDDDGRNDVFLLDAAGGLSLHHALPDGSFSDVTEASQLPRRMPPYCAALGDFDGDARVDVVVGPHVFRNLGGLRFSDVSYKSTLDIAKGNGTVVADFDLDGRLDVYVVRSSVPGEARSKASWFDGPGGPANQMWLNRGNWRFEEVGAALGVTAGRRSSFAAACLDKNGDGRPDLYVISEFGPGVLFINGPDGKFTEEQLETDDGDFGSMGLAVGDYDGDGRTDIYTANMYSKAGRRILVNLAEDAYPPEVVRRMKRFVTGSELYRDVSWVSDGVLAPTGLDFERVGGRLGLKDVGWAYGASFTDLDGDGMLDLHATAGFISVDPSDPDG